MRGTPKYPLPCCVRLRAAGALALGYSNIFVTAPSPENLRTLFEFVFKGLDELEYKVRWGADACAAGAVLPPLLEWMGSAGRERRRVQEALGGVRPALPRRAQRLHAQG